MIQENFNCFFFTLFSLLPKHVTNNLSEPFLTQSWMIRFFHLLHFVPHILSFLSSIICNFWKFRSPFLVFPIFLLLQFKLVTNSLSKPKFHSELEDKISWLSTISATMWQLFSSSLKLLLHLSSFLFLSQFVIFSIKRILLCIALCIWFETFLLPQYSFTKVFKSFQIFAVGIHFLLRMSIFFISVYLIELFH